MSVYIYCRVCPHDRAVAKSDRLKSQERRCREFLRDIGISRFWIYRDEGEMNPVHLLPSMKRLLEAIAHDETEPFIISDHHGRLGKTPVIQRQTLTLIHEAGARFFWTSYDSKNHFHHSVEATLQQLRAYALSTPRNRE